MRLGATDSALPAAIFCSLTSGVQKLEIFSYTKKFGLDIVNKVNENGVIMRRQSAM